MSDDSDTESKSVDQGRRPMSPNNPRRNGLETLEPVSINLKLGLCFFFEHSQYRRNNLNLSTKTHLHCTYTRSVSVKSTQLNPGLANSKL